MKVTPNPSTPPRIDTLQKCCRFLSIVLLIAVIVFIAWRFGIEDRDIVSKVDDFFLFMAAFTFAHGSFQRPERHRERQQLYMLALLFLVIGLCWLVMLLIKA